MEEEGNSAEFSSATESSWKSKSYELSEKHLMDVLHAKSESVLNRTRYR